MNPFSVFILEALVCCIFGMALVIALHPSRRYGRVGVCAMVGWPCGGREIPRPISSVAPQDSRRGMEESSGTEVKRSAREWQNSLLPISQRLELLRERGRSQSRLVRDEFAHYVSAWDRTPFDEREIQEEAVVFSQVVIMLVEWPGFLVGLAQSLAQRVLDPQEAAEIREASIHLLFCWNTHLGRLRATSEAGANQIQGERRLASRTLLLCLESQCERVRRAVLSGLLSHSKVTDSSDFRRFNHAILKILKDPKASEGIKALALSVANERSLNQLAPVAEALAVNEDTSLLVRAASLGVLDGKDRERVISQVIQQGNEVLP